MATSRVSAQANFFGDGFADHHGWLEWLHETLPKPNLHPDAPLVIDLFAGCGGLALGFEAQGFRTVGYEMKPVAVRTYNANLHGRCEETFLKVGIPEGQTDVLIGGPPCQPFSQIGYQRGKEDSRDGFPIFLDAVRRIQPKTISAMPHANLRDSDTPFTSILQRRKSTVSRRIGSALSLSHRRWGGSGQYRLSPIPLRFGRRLGRSLMNTDQIAGS
jgi:hypothetical protein